MELKIEYLNIEQLKPYEKNAKLHDSKQVEQIKNSIKEFGMNDPIAIWKDNIIVEGHGRLLACKELNINEVPVIRLDHLTDEQRKAYCLAHNKTTMNSGFDMDTLMEELEFLKDTYEMADFGFEDALATLEQLDAAEDDDYEVVVPEEAKSKRGDLYKLGRHRLLVGDSTILEDVEKILGGCRQTYCLQTHHITWTTPERLKMHLRLKMTRWKTVIFESSLQMCLRMHTQY